MAVHRLPPDSRPRPRLLACDLDGPLIDADGALRQGSREAIALVAASGVHVVIATGRSPWGGVRLVADELGLAGPQVTFQGAMVSDPATGRVHSSRPLTVELFEMALRFAELQRIEPVVALADGQRAAQSARAAQPVVSWCERVRPEADLHRLAGVAPLRVYLPTDPERHAALRASARHTFGSRASIVWTDLDGLEILAPRTNKGRAIAWLAARLGIGMDEVAAVGDGANDREMIRDAGQSAAMADAPAEVIAVADHVVPRCDEDGLVVALRGFFPDLAHRLH